MFSYILLFFLLALQAAAYPLHSRHSPVRTVTTVTNTDTAIGVVRTTCVITFTPSEDARGEPIVVEVRTCEVVMIPNDPDATTTATATSTAETQRSSTTPTSTSPSTTPTDSATTVPVFTLLPSSTLTSATETQTQTPSVVVLDPIASGTSTTAAQTSTTTTTAAGPTGDPIVVIGTSAIPAPVVPSATAVPSVTPIPTSSVPRATVPSSTAPSSTATTSGLPDAQAAAEETPFTLPGQKLSVLPIGLGVFAGISVVALIVVGLVTYERTKYRKTFRQRKLAETGATMGFGGSRL